MGRVSTGPGHLGKGSTEAARGSHRSDHWVLKSDLTGDEGGLEERTPARLGDACSLSWKLPQFNEGVG